MSLNRVLCPFLSLIVLLAVPIHATAHSGLEGSACEKAVVSGPEERAIDDLATSGALATVPFSLRQNAREAVRKINRLDQKILKLRLMRGSWELPELTEKRVMIQVFESLLMLNNLKMLVNMYAPRFQLLERSYVRYLSAEATVNALKRRLLDEKNGEQASLLSQQLKKDESEQSAAQVEFLDLMERYGAVSFVLEIMHRDGVFVDVSTMFGSQRALLDINGGEIKGVQRDMYRMGVECSSVAQGGEVCEPAVKTPPLARLISRDEVRKRADMVTQEFGKYFGSEPVQKLIQAAREAGDSSFSVTPPKHEDYRTLRARIGPDWSSTAQILKHKRDLYRKELKLRWQLRVGVPQLAEQLSTWLGKLDTKYTNAFKPIVRRLGLEYDAAVRRRHLAQVLTVAAIKNPADRLGAMEENNAETSYSPKGEFVVTFIRLWNNREQWNEVMDYLKSKAAESTYYAGLLKQYEAYEQEAVVRGTLPLLGNEPDYVGTLVSAGTSAAAVAGTSYLATHGVGWVGPYAGAAYDYSIQHMEALLKLIHVMGGG